MLFLIDLFLLLISAPPDITTSVNGKLDLSSSELLTTITSQKEQRYNINFTPYKKILIRFTAGHVEDIIIDMSVVKVVG
jgi:hypothetical protein